LIDCGGSCEACPTCSDGAQNQGEEGIDCGGSCPNNCVLEIPKTIDVKIFSYILVGAILLSIIVVKLHQILKSRKQRE